MRTRHFHETSYVRLVSNRVRTTTIILLLLLTIYHVQSIGRRLSVKKSIRSSDSVHSGVFAQTMNR